VTRKSRAGRRVLLALGLASALAVAPATVWGRPDAGDAPGPRPHYDPARQEFGGYDVLADPNHPLKNGDRDPGEKWEGPSRRYQEPGLSAKNKADWDWGELYYDGSYATELVIKNACKSEQTVSIFPRVAYLDIPYTVTVPGESEVSLQATVVTPPAPPPPLLTGQPDEPVWGWVKPPPIPPFQPLAVDRYEFHQPNFLTVEGSVVAWHPWTRDCNPKRSTWTVAGHIHFRPPPPSADEGGGGPEEIASEDPCAVYWRLGERPAQLKNDAAESCTAVMRGLAIDYRERILAPHVERSPDAWRWLPGLEEIQSMTVLELLALKARGDELLARS